MVSVFKFGDNQFSRSLSNFIGDDIGIDSGIESRSSSDKLDLNDKTPGLGSEKTLSGIFSGNYVDNSGNKEVYRETEVFKQPQLHHVYWATKDQARKVVIMKGNNT